MEILARVCDMCKSPDAEEYLIRSEGRSWFQVDLCEKCAKPLAKMIDVARPSEPPSRPHRRFEKTTLPPQPGEKGRKGP